MFDYGPQQSSQKRRIRRIFMPTFGCVRVHCPAWDSNYANFFFLLTLLKLLKTSVKVQIWFPPQKIRRSPPIRCHRVGHKMSSCPIAVGIIPFSSQSIKMSHSDCVFNIKQDNNYAFANLRSTWSIGFIFSQCVY